MYLIFDIGGSAIKYCYANEQNEIINKQEFETTPLTNLELFIGRLSDIYFQSEDDIEGIAISCPGVIDAKTGIIKTITAYPYLQGICLTKLLSKVCNGVKVTIENDAKCAGLAEALTGNAKDYKDALVVVLGTGIGGAVIKDRKIHHGANLSAGEISTMIVDYDKSSHQILTWSDIASTSALCKRVAVVLNIEKIDGRTVFEMVRQNNQDVIKVLDSFCFDIAIQLFNLQHLYDPEVICIGGGISRQNILIEKIQEAIITIHNRSNQLLLPHVVSCRYYNEANLLGALYHFKMTK